MEKIEKQTKELLGSVISIEIEDEHANRIDKCFEIISNLEEKYSRFKPSSTLSKLNEQIGNWQKVDEQTFELLIRANELYEDTDGYFDITIKEILDSLGYDKDYSFKVKSNESGIHKQLQRYEIDPITNEIKLLKQIDFGGFGKGLALDLVSNFLDENNVSHYLINAGGDIYAKRSKGMPAWKILLENPFEKDGNYIGIIEIDDFFIAGSGPNKRKWADSIHHLINPKTNLPQNENAGIFVIGQEGLVTDAFSTGLFVAGFEKGIELANKNGIDLFLISSDGKNYKSNNFPTLL